MKKSREPEKSYEKVLEQFLNIPQVQELLTIIEELHLPEGLFAGGSIYRNLWNIMTGLPVSFDTDVDLIYYDLDGTYEESLELEARLKAAYPQYDWEVRNQAVMHIIYKNQVPYRSVEDAMRQWPEVSTAIGLRQTADKIEWVAPFGMADVFAMIVCPTPKFAAKPELMAVFMQRKASKNLQAIYPQIRYAIASQFYLGQTVTVIMDRPLGSHHPEHGFSYPVNYGYIANTVSPDGEELDAYVLGVSRPVSQFTGKVLAVIHRLNDEDDKLIVVPSDTAIDYSDEQIRSLTEFQEQYFDSEIWR